MRDTTGMTDPNEKMMKAVKTKLQNEGMNLLQSFKNNYILKDYSKSNRFNTEVKETITKRKINREYKDGSKYHGEVTFDGSRKGIFHFISIFSSQMIYFK